MTGENKKIVYRKFYLTLVSAQNLPNVRSIKFKSTRSYAEISMGTSEKEIIFRTDVDEHNGLNPAWNQALACDVAESGVLYHGLPVDIKLYCKRKGKDSKYIGEVHMTMKDLFDKVPLKKDEGSAKLSLPITQGGKTTSGTLNFSYSFGKRSTVKKRDFMNKVFQDAASIVVEMGKVAASAMIFAILPGVS